MRKSKLFWELIMLREHAGEALSDVGRDILEKMCFVSAEEVVQPPEGAQSLIAAEVEFRGFWIGRCAVQMPESCARMIAGNFIGILDPDEVEPTSMIELVCEFVNMVCGGTITRMDCGGFVTLAPPHLIWTWPYPSAASEMAPVERWLDTGGGIVRLGFEVEMAP